jgi:hypothetical protein
MPVKRDWETSPSMEHLATLRMLAYMYNWALKEENQHNRTSRRQYSLSSLSKEMHIEKVDRIVSQKFMLHKFR